MTTFDEIINRSMIVIRDYRLDSLAQTNINAFKEYMSGFVIKAIPSFDGCLTDLSYNETTASFDNTLSYKEQDILADLVVLTWFEALTNDITQVNLHLQSRDKKTHSENSNLKEKGVYLDKLREKVRQSITDYQNNNFDAIYKFN